VDGGALASSSSAAAAASADGSKSGGGGFNVLLVPVALVAAAAVALVVRKFMNREQEGEFCFFFGLGRFRASVVRASSACPRCLFLSLSRPSTTHTT
jgi:hypothetical protein